MKSPRFAIENVLLHLSEHFTYLNSGEDKSVRIIEGLLFMHNLPFLQLIPLAELLPLSWKLREKGWWSMMQTRSLQLRWWPHPSEWSFVEVHLSSPSKYVSCGWHSQTGWKKCVRSGGRICLAPLENQTCWQLPQAGQIAGKRPPN